MRKSIKRSGFVVPFAANHPNYTKADSEKIDTFSLSKNVSERNSGVINEDSKGPDEDSKQNQTKDLADSSTEGGEEVDEESFDDSQPTQAFPPVKIIKASDIGSATDEHDFQMTQTLSNQLPKTNRFVSNRNQSLFKSGNKGGFTNPMKRQKIDDTQSDLPQPSSTSPSEDSSPTGLSAEEINHMNSYGNIFSVTSEARYFNVVWCKKSMKKHKTWEGDGILTVKSRSAVLKSMEGKTIGSGIGYKAKEVSQLTEGSKFFIGGKECEIQHQIPNDEYLSGKCFQSQGDDEEDLMPTQSQVVRQKFRSPFAVVPPKNDVEEVPRLPRDPKFLYMPDPSSHHQFQNNQRRLPVVDVKVDPYIAQHLRPHQKEGIVFMYECIQGFRNYRGQGAILADEMGLGKTLQCISLIWTLFKQGPYGGNPVLKKVLTITPSSLVKNWEAEFYKWLGKERIAVFAVGPKRKVNDFVNSRYSILIISYEMYVRSAKALSSVTFDLVICDEGHRLKNVNIKTSEVIMRMPTKRRILLTGTPIQNDLEEFYSIVEFANPGILGSISSFRKVYQNPIMKSHNPFCTDEEKELGQSRSAELSHKTKSFFLRRTQDVINKYLPPKFEVIVFCRPTEIQRLLYQHLLQSKDLQTFIFLNDGVGACGGFVHLQYISALRKLCNHPKLLHASCKKSDNELDNSVIEHMRSGFPENYVYELQQSGKMMVLENLISHFLSKEPREKVVVVSNFTQTLDIIEDLCKTRSYEFLRLDGSTSSSLRLELVEKFNASYTKYCIFLLSSKAGGVGLNLVGASRIVLYDIDWNPATDLQAMARVWRDGQKKPVYIYRFLTTGTIEEKIYQRQVMKQGLSGTVIDSCFSFKSQFSYDDLKDIFKFHDNTQCLTHDSIECHCLDTFGSFTDAAMEASHLAEKENSQTDKLQRKKNTTMAELLKWKHIPSPLIDVDIPNTCLEACGKDISFLFTNSVNLKK